MKVALVSHCRVMGFIVFSTKVHSTIAPLRSSEAEELLLHVLEVCLVWGAVIPLCLDKAKGPSTAVTLGWNCPPRQVTEWMEGMWGLCEINCLSSKPIKSAQISLSFWGRTRVA